MAVRFVPSPSKTPFRDALRRQAGALAVLVLGLAITGAVATYLARGHADAERAAFESAAAQRTASLDASLRDEVHDLESMALLISVTSHFDLAFFRDAARFHQQRRGAVGGLVWIPRVPHSQREAFEAAARAEGFEGFRIVDRTAAGERQVAPAREEYFPNLYREPLPAGRPGHGLDIGNDPSRRDALAIARDSARTAATGRVAAFFITGARSPNAVQAFFPVYHGSGTEVPETVEARRARFRGAVANVLPAEDLVDASLPEGLPDGWTLQLSAASGTREGRGLLERGPAIAPGALRYEALIGPNELRIAVAFAKPAPALGAAPWTALAIGGVLSLLLAMLVGSLKARREEEREGEARFAAILEACPDAMVVKDSELRYRMVNRAFCERARLSSAQAIGRTNEELFGDALPPHVREAEEACSRTSLKQSYEFRAERDGDSTWYESVVVPLGEGRQRDGSIVVTVRDITARKELETARDARARDALRASEDRFRALAMLASDWFWEQDAELRFVRSSEEETRAMRDARWLGDRPYGLRRWEIPGFATAPEALAAHRATLERREPFRNFEYSVTREDGAVHWFSASGEPVFGADGAFLGYRGTARDATAERLREARLRESEARFRALADMASDWYWEQDAQGRFTAIGYDGDGNPATRGIGPPGAMGRARWELPGLVVDPAALAEHRATVLERHAPFRGFEYGLRLEGGSISWYSASGEPVFDADGTFRGYRGIGRDITERRRAMEVERELSEQRRAVLENLLAAVIVIDERGTIETFSRQAEAIFGYAAHEVVGRNVSMLVPEPYRQRHDGYLERYGRTGERRIIGATRELYGVRKDGREVPIELGITEIVVDGRRKYTGMVRDLTARRAAQAALVASEERFRSLFENSPEAVVVQDGAAILMANAAAAALFGVPDPRELVGHRMREFMERDDEVREGIVRMQRLMEAGGIRLPVREYHLRGRDGTRRVAEAVSASYRTADGVRIVTTYRDVTGQHEARAALAASEERFRSLFENSPEPVIVQDGRQILMINPAGMALLGAASAEELLGRYLGEFVFDDGERAVGEDRQRQLLESAPAQVPMREYGFKRLDGTRRIVEAVSASYHAPEGARIITIYRDVTEQRAARVALAESEDRFRRLFDVSPDGVALHDGRTFELLNAEALRILGARTHEDVAGRGVLEFFLEEPERSSAAVRLEQARLSEGAPTPMREYRLRTLDGVERYAESSTIAIPGSGGRRFMSVVRDTTERRKSEQAVRLSEARLREVMDLVPHFIFIKDREGRYLMTNRACAEHFGCTPETILGRTPEDLGTSAENARRIREADARVRATGGRVVSEHPIIRADGGARTFVTTRMPVRFSDEHPDAVLAVSIDVTEIRESERRLREIIDLVPHFIVAKDRDGRYLLSNRAYAEFFGREPQGLIGRTPEEIGVDPAAAREIREVDARARATGEAQYVPEEVVTSHTGRSRTYATMRTPYRFSAEHPDAVLVVSIDISDIRESERRLREILDVVPHPIYAKDRNGRYLLSNRAHAAFYGRTPDEIVGNHGRALAPNRDERDAMAAGDGRVLETLASDRQLDVVRTDAAGRARHLNLTKIPFSYFGGEVDSVLGISIDITDLVEAHAKVRESLALLEATLESTDNGFLVTDAAGRIVRWNRRMLQLFEMPDAALEALESGDRAALLAITRDTFADPDAVAEASRAVAEDPGYEGVYTAVLKDGRFVERYTQPMLRDGLPAGRVWSYRDVTSRERERIESAEREAVLEQRVDERTRELTKAVADLTLFTSAISHDLRAPLRAVGGFVDMAIEDGGDTLAPQSRRHLERVVNAVRNMNAMVEGLLALARQTRAPIHRQPVDVAVLAREVFDELSQGAAQDGATVAAHAAELRVSPCPPANADPILLRNVLQNLIGNALKYSRKHERPVIEVGAIEHEGRPAWFVRDNGAGFDPKYADKLFQPFGRLHSPREFEGTGIGLAAVHRILERHGGRIWADARPGEGATFWFSLP